MKQPILSYTRRLPFNTIGSELFIKKGQNKPHHHTHCHTPVVLATRANTPPVRLETALKLQVLEPQALILGLYLHTGSAHHWPCVCVMGSGSNVTRCYIYTLRLNWKCILIRYFLCGTQSTRVHVMNKMVFFFHWPVSDTATGLEQVIK